MYYKLNPDRTISAVDDARKANHVSIARTYLEADIFVSTVFLGLDHQFMEGGPPLVFETMVFTDGTFCDCFQERSSTFEEAFEAHKNGIQYALENELKGIFLRVQRRNAQVRDLKESVTEFRKNLSELETTDQTTEEEICKKTNTD